MAKIIVLVTCYTDTLWAKDWTAMAIAFENLNFSFFMYCSYIDSQIRTDRGD